MSARVPDGNGWFEIPGNPLSRAGVFDYLGSSIHAPEPNKMYRVYRAPAELMNPTTLNSFRLVPLINDHVMLGKATPDAIPAEQKGVHGVIGDNVYYDENMQAICGNLKVFSDNLQRVIAAGKVDLSCGYKCKYKFEPGVTPEGVPYDATQHAIMGNHLALVQDGRMGDAVSVMDSLTFTFDAKDIIMAKSLKERNKAAYDAAVKKFVSAYGAQLAKKNRKFKNGFALATMDAKDEEAVSSEPTLSDVADLLGDIMPQISDINDALVPDDDDDGDDDDMEPELDAAGQPVMDAAGKPVMKKKIPAAAVATPQSPAATAADGKGKDDDGTMMDGKGKDGKGKDGKMMDAKAMDAAVSAAVAKALAPLQAQIATMDSKSIMKSMVSRDDLAAKVSRFVGTFDAREMTVDDVAKYAVGKLHIPTVAGQEVVSVQAWLHGREPAKSAFTVGMDGKPKSGGSSVDKFLASADAA
jgi:hypothetical protein